jgi:hypothetical protein
MRKSQDKSEFLTKMTKSMFITQWPGTHEPYIPFKAHVAAPQPSAD